MATDAELLTLVLAPNETLASEYKSWLNLTVNEDKAKLAKAAIALANHGGGQIVMGIGGPTGQAMRSQDRPSEIRRYDPDAVNAAINRYAEPSIHCDVQFVNHPDTGFEHAIISVPGISSVPVMCIRSCENVITQQRCYIRKPGPKSEEPFTAEEWRGLINRCIQTGRETLLDSIRYVLAGQVGAPTGNTTDSIRDFAIECRGRWEDLISVLPDNDPGRMTHGRYIMAFEVKGVEPASTLTEVKRRLETAQAIRFTGWSPFVIIDRPPISPHPADSGIEAWLGHTSEHFRDGRHSEYWRVTMEPRLFEIRSFDEDFHSRFEAGSIFDPTLAVWRVGETLLYVARFANLFGDDPEISIFVRYEGLNRRRLESVTDARYFASHRISSVEDIETRWTATASQIENNLVEVVHSILKPVLECFDFLELPVTLVTEELARMRSGRF